MGKHQKNRYGWKNQKHHTEEKRCGNFFHKRIQEKILESKEKQEAIIALKQREVLCSLCNEKINDISSAIDDKSTGKPAHFDCVLKKLNQDAGLKEGESLTYIGKGRFALVHYENPNEVKSFKIVKIIEYEETDSHSDWRTEMSELYSKVL